ncbi:hypothetical protein CBI30_02355 [Polynucleobacter aenigmaticus]|uniref:Uncharacterized protein n=1 Tax=Polynucleobacter aenigmaticus TaxID=1743164 RepID=A0A254Q223_9BURK|nr:hypothetical protein CBI30_02355 [Polynucleobacter aenigmaticus]
MRIPWVRNGRIVFQLTKDVIKRLGGDMAWWHAALFALRIGKTIRQGRIAGQKNLPQTSLNKGFGAFRKIHQAPYNLILWLYLQKTGRL